jgi:broad specificity phosphatase PhoE
MTEFLFIRHGETDANKKGMLAGKKDVPLNQKGVYEACETAHALAGERADAVYCGNAKRVRQTFELVKDSFSICGENIFFTDDIREMNMGRWEGKDFTLVSKQDPSKWAEYMKDWAAFTFPGGESPKDYFRHCSLFINTLKNRHSGERVIVFGHKGFILSCACVLEQKPMERLFERDIKTGSYFSVNCAE